jgi:hypothetical protein
MTIEGLNSGGDKRFLTSPNYPHRLNSPPCPLFKRILKFFHGEKRPERDVELSTLCSAGAKNALNCSSTPLICLPALRGVSLPFFKNESKSLEGKHICVLGPTI